MAVNLLARAADLPLNADAPLVMVGVALVAGVAVVSAVPVVIAVRRGHPWREGIVAAVILWGMVAAGVGLWVVNRNWTAAADAEREVDAGVLDPRDVSSPGQPWAAWGGLAVAYVGLVGWSVAGRR